MRKVFRKVRAKRPIHIRVLAIVMALVMVLSVIYINHRGDKVKADGDPQEVSYTDDGFIDGKVDVTKDDQSLTINVPAKGVKFKLPDASSREEGEHETGTFKAYKRTIPAEGENPEQIDYALDDKFSYDTDNPKPDNVTIDELIVSEVSETTASWKGTNVASGYVTSAADTTTATLEVVEKVTAYKVGNTDFTTEADGLGKATGGESKTEPVKITVKTYIPDEITTSVDQDNKVASFVDSSYPTSGENYGSTKYTLSKDGAVVVADTTLSAVNDSINADKTCSGDGDYTVTRTVTVGETKIGSDTTQNLTRNFYIVKTVSATDGTNTYNGSTSEITIPTDGKANPTVDLTISIETDKNATLTITDPSGGPASSAKSDGSTTNSFKIAGDVSNNAKTPTYTVTVSDGTATETVTVNVNYGDGTPSVYSESYTIDENASARADELKYAKSASATISAGLSCASDSGASISLAELFTVSESATSTSGGTNVASTSEGSEGVYSFPVTLTPGKNFYMIKATSSYSKTAETGKYSIFYDDKAPALTGEVTVKQSSHSTYGGGAIASGTNVTIPNKITSRESASLSIAKAAIVDKQSDDSNGSGVDKVYFKVADGTEQEVGLVDDKYSVEIPADSSKENGGSTTVTFYAKDKAGNQSDTYTVLINYYDETISVESDITPEAVNGFFKWGETTPVAKINYTIISEVPITTATIDDGSGASTVTLSSAGTDDATGKNKYTYEYNYPIVEKKDIAITLYVENANGNFKSDTSDIRHVDITSPTASVEVDSSSEAGDMDGSKQWYHKLVLLVTVSDGTISSGIKSITAEGTEKTDYTSDMSAAGIFLATVNESASSAGTVVKFVVKDNAENTPGTYTGTWYVDKTYPTISFTVGDKTDDAIKNFVFQTEPKVTYTVSDTPSEIAEYTVTLSDGSTTKVCTDTSFNGKKISEILETSVSDTATYSLKIVAKDKSGLTTTKETQFKVDTVPPEVKITIVSPDSAVKSAYPRIYKDNVTLKFTASDATITSETQLTVTDSENHEVNPTWNKQDDGSWFGTATLSIEGNYKVTFTAKDSGGISRSDSVSFTIDKTLPEITTLVNAKVYDKSSEYFDNTATLTIQVKDTNEDENDVTTTIKRTAFDGTETTDTKKGKGPFICSEEGKYVITVKAIDKAGNENSKSIGYTVDKSDPVPKIEIVTKPLKIEGYFNQDSVELSLTIDDSTVLEKDITVTDNDKKVNVNWSIKDGKAVATYNATTEETHSVTLAVKDQSGNEAKTTKTFVIDRTKPKLTTKVNSKEYNSKDDYFSGNVTSNVVVKDDNEDKKDVTATIQYDAFNGNYSEEVKNGKGPFTFKKQGKYSITYKVVDKAGNEKSKTIGFYIDKTNPVGNMYIKTDKPPKFSRFNASYVNKVNKFKQRKNQEAYEYGQYYNESVTIEFNYFDYGMDSVTITDGDEEIIPDWTEDDGYGKGTAKITDEGHHVIKMTIEDKAGNTVSYKSGSRILDFYIDKTAPSVSASVNGTGSGDIVTTNGTGSVTVTVEDANKDPDDITMTVSSTGAGGGSSKVSEGSQSFDAEADYDVQFTAVDKAGNSSSPASAKFRVDRTAPQLEITSNASNGASKTDVDVTFSIKETFFNDLAVSKIDVYRKVDGDTEKHYKTINFSPRGTSDSLTETFTEDGEYRCVFTARDKAGNEASEKYTFILDGSKPIITLSGVNNYDKTNKNVELGVEVDETFYLTNKVTVDGTVTDISGEKKKIDFDAFPSDSAKISTLTKMFTQDGIYDITVTSTDKAGNTDSKTVHFTIDKTPPVIDDLSAYDGTKVNSFTLDKPLEELVTDLTVCEIKMYMDGNLYDGSGALSDGAHVLRIEATDEMGHTSTREVSFILDTIAPNIIVTGAEDGAVLKDAGKVTVSVELDDDYLDYVKLNGETIAVSGNECVLEIDKRGRYKLEAAASDGAGNKSSIEMQFSYGHTFLWMILGIAAVLVVAIAAILAFLSKQKKSGH
ncbi:MAG: Ig-like domain repeat protein [Eubacterium sp.]|nr:Ig-like domain repeat protein [Eubacterium sp.]